MPLAISLRTNNGLFIGAEDGGGQQIDARRAIPREHETFFLYSPPEYTRIKGNDKVTLQTYDGHYVMAVNAGGGEVNARSTQGSSWETFTILRQDLSNEEITSNDRVALKTFDDRHYIMAVNGGGREINAFSTQLGEWETFTIQIHGSAPIRANAGPTKVGDGQFMRSTIIFSDTGWVYSENGIWTDNKTYGFTGGVGVFFTDRATNIIGNLPLHTYGVDGTWVVGLPSSRTITQNDFVGTDIFSKTLTIYIFHIKAPHKRLRDAVNELAYIGKKVSEVYKDFK